MKRRRVAFLFLGETLLIPHLYPIAEALVSTQPDIDIDLWVSTSVHEKLIGRWTAALGNPRLRIRRAPGFRQMSHDEDGHNPELPNKLLMLARVGLHLLRADVVVCAEQTSLWIPRVSPTPARFVKTSHGVGSMSARDDKRRKAAWLTLVPSERERATYLARGMAPDRIVATGYVKAGFRHRTHSVPPFATPRPVILYTPHWQRHRSSWWAWGREVVARITAEERFNLIFAPHQRLVENAPELREFVASLAGHPAVHCDLDSFAMVDGSYTEAADLYLGDTSSQVIEYLRRPRPCVFLDPGRTAWQDDPSYAMWACGEVVSDIDALLPALARAPEVHVHYSPVQAAYAADALGDVSGEAPDVAAAQVMRALR